MRRDGRRALRGRAWHRGTGPAGRSRARSPDSPEMAPARMARAWAWLSTASICAGASPATCRRSGVKEADDTPRTVLSPAARHLAASRLFPLRVHVSRPRRDGNVRSGLDGDARSRPLPGHHRANDVPLGEHRTGGGLPLRTRAPTTTTTASAWSSSRRTRARSSCPSLSSPRSCTCSVPGLALTQRCDSSVTSQPATERLNVEQVATLDRRHFTIVLPRHLEAFVLLP